MSVLDRIVDQLYSCNKCGFCQATCPSYQESKSEFMNARGRLRLILAVAEGELQATHEFVEMINTCLQCRACGAACPSGVGPDRLILAAREYLARTKGLPFVKKMAVSRVLPSCTLMGLSVGAFRWAKTFFLRPGNPLSKVRGVDLSRIPVASRPFNKRVPEVNPGAEGGKNGRVAFFHGCFVNHFQPEIGEATVRVLQSLGYDVIVPKNQHCCGLPSMSYGEAEAARSLVRHNLELFKELDVSAVVTSCATCGSGLKHDYTYLLQEDEEYLPAAEKFSAQVFDISEFLFRRIEDLSEIVGSLEATVTYHDPCHLLRSQAISEEPRKLLEAVPGLEFREMREADHCCGAAGIFQIFYPEISKPLTERKVSNIIKTGAETVASGCPGCMVRINNGLSLQGAEVEVVHPVQLLDRALARATAYLPDRLTGKRLA